MFDEENAPEVTTRGHPAPNGFRPRYPFSQAVELSGWRVRPGRAADRFPAKATVPRFRPPGPSRLRRTVTGVRYPFRDAVAARMGGDREPSIW